MTQPIRPLPRLVALAGLLLSLSLHAAPPAEVIVAPVQQAAISDRVEALGTLRANESIEVSATVSDTVTHVYFNDGDRVQAGDLLLTMTSDEEDAQLREARATLQEALSQYQRVRALADKGTAAQSALDERRREWETAKARLTVLEARLADRVIKAPFGGVLGLRNLSVGALVRPGDLITTLDDDSVMKLDFAIPAVYLEGVQPGAAIRATTPAFRERVFEGTVHSLDSRIDEVTRTLRVRALLPNPQALLRPGMLMYVDLALRPRQALLVPEEALVPKGSAQSVLMVEDGKAVQRTVQIGTRLPGKVEIVSGLQPGEQVITQGAVRVRPGQAVQVSRVDDGSQTLGELLKKP